MVIYIIIIFVIYLNFSLFASACIQIPSADVMLPQEDRAVSDTTKSLSLGMWMQGLACVLIYSN